MPARPCACGYDATSEDDLTDHLSRALIPADDKAPDGQLHAEAVGHSPWTCLCGHHAATLDALDAHLLTAFSSTHDTEGSHGIRVTLITCDGRVDMTNLTLTIEDDVLRMARIRALELGTSVNALVREYLKQLAGRTGGADGVAEFLAATKGAGAGSGSEGRTWSRDELYDR
jgi:hypothetical protein